MKKLLRTSLLVLLAFSLALVILLPMATQGHSPWKAAEVLAVPSELPESDVLKALSAHGLRDILSSSTQMVSISSFDKMEYVPLSRVDDRLLPGDPRRDSWVDSLSRYFTARDGKREYSLYYLKRSAFQSRLTSRTIRSMEGAFLLESRQAIPFLPFLLPFLCSLWALFVKPSRFPRALLVAFPWALSAWGGTANQAFAAVTLSLSSLLYTMALDCWPFERKRGMAGRLTAILSEAGAPTAAIAGILGLFGLAVGGSWKMLAALPASFALALLSEGPTRRRRAVHPTFVPLAINPRRGSGSEKLAKSWSLNAVAVASVSALALAFSTSVGAPSPSTMALSFPHPGRYTPDGSKGSSIPGYGDFLAHLEHQASFMRTRLGSAGKAFRIVEAASDGTVIGMRVPGGEGQTDKGRNLDGLAAILRKEGDSTITIGPWEGKNESPVEASLPFLLILMASMPGLLGRKGRSRIREGIIIPMRAEMERKSA